MAPISKRSISSTIEKQDENARLDRWLTKRFTYRSRAQWQELIKTGKILVNEKKCRSSKSLKHGDKIEFITDDFIEPEVDTNYKIVYEDTNLIAVNKPGNLPCHPAGAYFQNTLWTLISDRLDTKIYTVNRLDRETSGIILMAKSSEAAKKLSELFVTNQILKKYTVIVHGTFPEKLIAKGHLTSDKNSIIRKKRVFIPMGETKDELFGETEYSETHFKLIASNNNFSCIEVQLKTGRLHQIRATLCSLGYPVVGDKIYGLDDTFYQRFIDNELVPSDKEKLILDRQALHSFELSFKYPGHDKDLKFVAQMPQDMNELYLSITTI